MWFSAVYIWILAFAWFLNLKLSLRIVNCFNRKIHKWNSLQILKGYCWNRCCSLNPNTFKWHSIYLLATDLMPAMKRLLGADFCMVLCWNKVLNKDFWREWGYVCCVCYSYCCWPQLPLFSLKKQKQLVFTFIWTGGQVCHHSIALFTRKRLNLAELFLHLSSSPL